MHPTYKGENKNKARIWPCALMIPEEEISPFKTMGKKNLPSQSKSARKRKEKSQGKRLQNCNFSLSVCSVFRAVSRNICGLKTSMWGENLYEGWKLGNMSLVPLRETGLNIFLVSSCKSSVPSREFCHWDTFLLCWWAPSILSSITPFTLFLRRHMVKEMFCISVKYIKTNSKPLCIKGTTLCKLT